MKQNPREPIAIIGMSGIFPGASDPEAFWSNIKNKVDTCKPVSAHRWIADINEVYAPEDIPDTARSIKACLIDQFSLETDHLNIDQELLASLDPLYQLTLSAGNQLLQHYPFTFDADRTSVILAAIALPTDASSKLARKMLTDSLQHRPEQQNRPPHPVNLSESLNSKVTSFPSSLLANAMGIKGGSYTLDAACASSLYAIKLACDDLYNGKVDTVVTGGVSRPDCLYTQIGFSQLQALSPSGQCSPFDGRADGLIVGEGVGLLVLKRLTDAINDQDTILATINGVGLSNDIGGNLLSPMPEGQLRALRTAYEKTNWAPSDIDLIECHGTGTPLGDQTELKSLTELWGKDGWKENQCAIGSVKSMIGHLLTAAGAASIIKVIQSLRYQTLPPSLHYSKPADSSLMGKNPFYVQTEATDWHQRQPNTTRKAAVNAFGFGGINSHVLLEEWNEERRNAQGDQSFPSPPSRANFQQNNNSGEPIAIIGMDVHIGNADSIAKFGTSIFKSQDLFTPYPVDRAKGVKDTMLGSLSLADLKGAFIQGFDIPMGKFPLPPNEVDQILPQQLLLLKTAAGALAAANIDLKQAKPRMSTLIGINFDMAATDFHLRWALKNQLSKGSDNGNNPADSISPESLANLRDQIGNPLNFTRTVGALGGITASRVAKAFSIGGPSFTLSADETSGLKGIEIGINQLHQGECDTVLVGSVDITGDIRTLIANSVIYPYTDIDNFNPFDKSSQGTVPGEGAVCLVLKRLSDAIADNDNIYATIKGSSQASEKDETGLLPNRRAYQAALNTALERAQCPIESIGLVETHGSGITQEDQLELSVLADLFKTNNRSVALSSLKSTAGHLGAAAGLASIAKAALCLKYRTIPPLKGFRSSFLSADLDFPIFSPHKAQYWYRNQADGPRAAIVSTMSYYGTCAHMILQEYQTIDHPPLPLFSTWQEDQKPYIILVQGENSTHLQTQLEALISTANQNDAWFSGWENKQDTTKLTAALVGKSIKELHENASFLLGHIQSEPDRPIMSKKGYFYHPNPPSSDQIAFVYPGSGNHYLGMGRQLALHWPDIFDHLDQNTDYLKHQILPKDNIPRRLDWSSGWQKAAHDRLRKKTVNMIYGQVFFSGVMTQVLNHLGLVPTASIGYSLGETASYFALGVWPKQEEMLKRLENSELFRSILTGNCSAARQVWQIPDNQPFDWHTVLVNRSAKDVRQILKGKKTTRLLIINSPDECVIGGNRPEVEKVVRLLECDAFILDGVVTAHCETLQPVVEEYRELHLFPTRATENIQFYSCTRGDIIELNDENAADSITLGALEGFDFNTTIKQAYTNGIRYFIEIGPGSSCTRMIQKILPQNDYDYLAVSASSRETDELTTLSQMTAILAAHNIRLAPEAFSNTINDFPAPITDNSKMHRINMAPPYSKPTIATRTTWSTEPPPQFNIKGSETLPPHTSVNQPVVSTPPVIPVQNINENTMDASTLPTQQAFMILQQMQNQMNNTMTAHNRFLEASQETNANLLAAFKAQSSILSQMIHHSILPTAMGPIPSQPSAVTGIAFDRDKCMEFAVGSIANVLGPDFSVVDQYPVRVRLPDEPLMLVDRIVDISGEKGSLKSGQIITEHDVRPHAWYLDENCAPVCITVEAGQADLFLCAYLGIDLAVKGRRSYRLLDATIKFHRGLPQPGETIRFYINIDRFVRQGETYLFFFDYQGYINDQLLITMTEGCAGFFTSEEIKKSGGLLDKWETPLTTDKFIWPLQVDGCPTYNEASLQQIRAGNFSSFGASFVNLKLSRPTTLPQGRMKLFDRVLKIEQYGGLYKQGLIQTEADIHPEDWFLTCHFVDDMVMPGTLMYECCAHTLRLFLYRMGWIGEDADVKFEPLLDLPSALKCRGPVTAATKKVSYQVDIKHAGYNPEPYVIADAIMHADGHPIVSFRQMSMKLTGLTQVQIENLWCQAPERSTNDGLYNFYNILSFCIGKPSAAFGSAYQIFDQDRTIARLPGPPYLFMDRVTKIEPEPWVLKAGGWIEAEYDVPETAWYFAANQMPSAPYCIILEIALQPCGWLAAYVGSALNADQDLAFRNLGGKATLYREITPATKRVYMRCRLSNVANAGSTIIEDFEMEVLDLDRLVLYQGSTSFGFFTKAALANQVGIRGAEQRLFDWRSTISDDNPNELDSLPLPPNGLTDNKEYLHLPTASLLMLDQITCYFRSGGRKNLGYIEGIKNVDPQEWFFQAHFYQDPVCPGSLGLESFMQLLKIVAWETWPNLAETHHFTPIFLEDPHEWVYRGQIIPKNKRVTVSAEIIECRHTPIPTIKANGFLSVDGLIIYEMINFGISMKPKSGEA